MTLCKDCGNVLKFSWELDNGNLCCDCGPGSLKAQAVEADAEKAKEFAASGRSAPPVGDDVITASVGGKPKGKQTA